MMEILSLLAAALLALQATPQDAGSVVQGVVTRIGTLEPLVNVHIKFGGSCPVLTTWLSRIPPADRHVFLPGRYFRAAPVSRLAKKT